MKNKVMLRKFIFLLIVIIIPLLATFFIGVYGYKRYQGEYAYHYMNNIEEVTESKIQGYLKFNTNLYEQDPIYSADVKHEDEDVFHIDIYKGAVTQQDSKTKEDYLQIQYYIAVYNVDYEKLVEIEDPTGEKKLLFDNIPSIYVLITDQNDPDNKLQDTLGTTSSESLIEDYNASPEKDYRGNELSSSFVRWLEVTPSSDFSKNVNIELYLTDSPSDSQATYHHVITSFELNNYDVDFEDVNRDEFEIGYEMNIFKAGYFGFVFKTKLWWQSLIAFALVGMITFSFYAVWNYEESTKNEKSRKR